MSRKKIHEEMKKKEVHFDSFIYSIKDSYAEEFLKLLNRKKVEMDRMEFWGTNEKIHVFKESDGQIRI